MTSSADGAPSRPRARDLGIVIGTLQPGPLNAITDVAGVGVGHRTLISGNGPLVVRQGPVRTGVSIVMPHAEVTTEPVFAGAHRLNGNGEMTGLEWLRESGLLTSPIGLTNTNSVGVVRDSLAEWETRGRPADDDFFALPVVAETWDGQLNDINGLHVRAEHAMEALEAVSTGPVVEGSVGGGTGMAAFGFKGGIGTASRQVEIVTPGSRTSYVVGVLVQANFGRRSRFTVSGVPVGRELSGDVVPLPGPPRATQTGDGPRPGGGSVIGICATDAPLLPHQCERVAQRIALGIGRLGGAGENSSGDLFLCFSTANRIKASPDGTPRTLTHKLEMLDDNAIDGIFHAVIEATEEAVLNSMLASDTMTGRDGIVAHALPVEELLRVLERGWSPLQRP